MFGAILKAANISFQKGITFCRSIYVKKVMKLLAFIFEQPSYNPTQPLIRLYFKYKTAIIPNVFFCILDIYDQM